MIGMLEFDEKWRKEMKYQDNRLKKRLFLYCLRFPSLMVPNHGFS